jgi:hypothetical protein
LCGEVGLGRMLEADELLEIWLMRIFTQIIGLANHDYRRHRSMVDQCIGITNSLG